MSAFNFTVHTDKMPGGWHAAYMPVYERLFASLRTFDNGCERHGRLLEIGTDGGGCLLAYQDYFPNYQVVGIDINQAPEVIQQHPRIKHVQNDAYSAFTPIEFDRLGQWNIIIDDGPHTPESQVFFVEHYTKLLTTDGIAIVEDVQDPAHIARLTAALPEGFFGFAIDLRAVQPERYDNLLFCVVRH